MARVFLIQRLMLVAWAAALGGCATIVGDETHPMPINSQPSDASVVITDEKGTEVFRGTTPATVTLQKNDGTYWGGKTHTVQLMKDGYQPQTISVTPRPNGWYIAGNLVFGGLIGWFLVDPWNGHMYKLSPPNIEATLPAR